MNDNLLCSAKAMDNYINEMTARHNFYEFINAINSKFDMNCQIQKTLSLIDKIIVSNESTGFKKCLENGTIYYRARIMDPADDNNTKKGPHKTKDKKLIGYDEFNSREPLLGIPGAGRNNIDGVSYLYIASNPETACTEIKSTLGDLISLATFKIKKPLYIYDFSTDIDKDLNVEDTLFGMNIKTFFTELMYHYTQPVANKDTYRVTQVISDHLRKMKILIPTIL